MFATFLFTPGDRQVWIGLYRLLFFVRLFVCTVTDFSAEDKTSGVKFCTAVHRRPRQGISYFCELCSPKAQNRTDQPARHHLHDVYNDYPLASEYMIARRVTFKDRHVCIHYMLPFFSVNRDVCIYVSPTDVLVLVFGFQ